MRTDELRCKYRQAKRTAKRAVAVAKAKKYHGVYEWMGTREGEKEVYRIAKARAQSQNDVGNAKSVKDENEEVLVTDNEIQNRWQRYFEGLMNKGAERRARGRRPFSGSKADAF